jgi:hypothetical protein
MHRGASTRFAISVMTIMVAVNFQRPLTRAVAARFIIPSRERRLNHQARFNRQFNRR